ncbi:hypothetical protein [Methylomonas sp. AM2-LC]|uniref:hypothetical protein n=1 Tax=Methylomonas sp. AM2-LC TaxID=3153301 RepID=UPI0032665BD6
MINKEDTEVERKPRAGWGGARPGSGKKSDEFKALRTAFRVPSDVAVFLDQEENKSGTVVKAVRDYYSRRYSGVETESVDNVSVENVEPVSKSKKDRDYGLDKSSRIAVRFPEDVANLLKKERVKSEVVISALRELYNL